jgi:hypothetical protein
MRALVLLFMLLASAALAEDEGERAETDVSIRQLRIAAEGGDIGAFYELGFAYLRGAGLDRDYGLARDWLTRAEAGGHAGAAYQLGLMARRGLGGRADAAASSAHLLKAARGGHALAQARLGVDYLEGSGVTKDPFEAYVWLSLAAPKVPPAAAQARRAAVELGPDALPRADAEVARRRATAASGG